MAVISAFTVIRAVSLFHITVAYFLLVSPQRLVEQPLVIVLGEAMGLPQVQDFRKATEVTAFTGLVLAFLGVSDLVAASLPDVTSLEYWLSQVPVRLFMLFGVTAYTYLFQDGGVFGTRGSTGGGNFANAFKRDRSAGELVRNNFIFSTGFIEVTTWFWIFVLLRDERRQLAGKLAQRQHEREEIYGHQ